MKPTSMKQKVTQVAQKFRPENSQLTDHVENKRNHMTLEGGKRHLLKSTGQGHGQGQEVGQGHLQNRKVMLGDQVCKVMGDVQSYHQFMSMSFMSYCTCMHNSCLLYFLDFS